MKEFKDLFHNDFKQTQADWESSLKAELKLEDISPKTLKKSIDIGQWPTLALDATIKTSLTSLTKWKKASQTYINIDPEKIIASIDEDLNCGVRVFFFYSDNLKQDVWDSIQGHLFSFEHKDELEIYFLGSSSLNLNTALKIYDAKNFLVAQEVHFSGGTSVHELAFLACAYIDHPEAKAIGVHLDSHFFKNIAKIRALKLLLEKISSATGQQVRPSVVALNSYREWTLFERYSNILRNNTQVASGLIAGAEVIQSSGYQLLFDLETFDSDSIHNERSLRMARNTAHILSLESTLGIVEDAAFGSYHLENLSQRYAEEAWLLMQKIVNLSVHERMSALSHDIKLARDERQERMKNRRDVFAGINDFPNVEEKLQGQLKASCVFRPARILEELRQKIQSLEKKPQVQILSHGDIAALNARMSFIKNYFEMIGLEVVHDLHQTDARIIVLCAKDEEYLELSKTIEAETSLARFVAGKIQLEGFESIYAGQNVYDVLMQLGKKMGVIG